MLIKIRWLTLGVLLVLTILVWLLVFYSEPSKFLTVSFLDVGQGDAILITAPNKNQVLIDGGPNQGVVRELGQTLPFFDRSIDLVIASHPDQDHIGGLPEVFNRYHIAGFMEPRFEAETQAYQNLQEKVVEEKSTHLIAKAGTKIILGQDVFLEVLSAKPWMLGPRGGKPDANNSSIVARLSYASTTFLLMGDLPIKASEQLAWTQSNKIKADVLKVSHHGAKNSSSLAFLKIVKPEYAVISVDENNHYNHPSLETLNWLKQVKAEILQTKDLGTITLKSDGQSVGF
jgi:competence protein ComEC